MINFKKKIIKKVMQKSEGTHCVDFVIGDANSTSVYRIFTEYLI